MCVVFDEIYIYNNNIIYNNATKDTFTAIIMPGSHHGGNMALYVCM